MLFQIRFVQELIKIAPMRILNINIKAVLWPDDSTNESTYFLYIIHKYEKKCK